MPGAWSRLVAEVREELAAARGQARAASAAAESRRAAAHARLVAVRSAHLGCVNSLGVERERARHAIETGFVAASRRLASSLSSFTADRSLVRIGTVRAPGCDTPLPALVPLLDRGHLWFLGDPSTVDDVLRLVLLGVLSSAPPGAVRLTVYDPERLGGTLSGFAPLGAAALARFVGPGDFATMMDGLVDEIQRLNALVLAAGQTSVAGMNPRPAPWQVVVLLGDTATADALTASEQAQLDRVLRLGPSCGIHVLGRGLPVDQSVTQLSIVDGTARCGAVADLPITLDATPFADEIAERCRALASSVMSGPPAASFADLLPARRWTALALDGLSAPVGTELGGTEAVPLALGDDPPHALIGGPSGSGKTNLIYAWLGALCARYSPDELALYLLDFKEGVSFARFAPSPRDPSWLPHVRLVGVNINDDREFGLALLRHLGFELRTRAAAAKRVDATKLSELRAEDPTGRWPRIVAVIDEFQVLLTGRDAVTTEAVALLEDLARRGRSQGIHLVLASQDVSGIEALWGRSGLVAQFTLRVALPKARRILADTNLAAETVPRFTAVVNADSGVSPANRVVRIPDASNRSAWRQLQHDLWDRRAPDAPPPRLFDGDAVPSLPPSPPAGPHPVALLGETIDVGARPAVFPLTRTPGRNLAVLGTRTTDACAILTAAALSLAPPNRTPGAALSLAPPNRTPGAALFVAPARRAARADISPSRLDDLAHLNVSLPPAGDAAPADLAIQVPRDATHPDSSPPPPDNATQAGMELPRDAAHAGLAMMPPRHTAQPDPGLAVPRDAVRADVPPPPSGAVRLSPAAATGSDEGNASDRAPRFSVVCLDDNAAGLAADLCAALPRVRFFDRSTVGDLVAELVAEIDGASAIATPHVVVGFAWDARPAGIDLKTVLSRGPERGIHVVGWWRTVARLRDDLGGPGGRTDAIGGWVALDVHGPDLSPLAPQPGGPTWYPRDRRALFFDRSTDRAPQVIVPYEIPADRLVAALTTPLPAQSRGPRPPAAGAGGPRSRDGADLDAESAGGTR